MTGRLGRIGAVLFLMLFLFSCGGDMVDVKPEPLKRTKRERLFVYMLSQRPINDEIFYEDEWFTYRLELERVVKGKYYLPSTSIGGECRYQGAIYTVFDKELNTVVRVRQIGSQPCNKCHQR